MIAIHMCDNFLLQNATGGEAECSKLDVGITRALSRCKMIKSKDLDERLVVKIRSISAYRARAGV
jgi:hypothetical protein